MTWYPLSIHLRSVNDKVQTEQKSDKNMARIIWKACAYLKTMEKTCAKFKKKKKKKKKKIVLNCMRSSRGTNCLYIKGEKWLSSQCGKSEKKNNLTITSKSHAHSHTMKKTHAKFHNNRYKTVRGVALTRGTNCLYIRGAKMTHNVEKVTKK